MSASMRRLACLVALISISSARDQSRWSRQISSYTSDMSDWVPLPGPVERPEDLPPIKRQAVAEPRILAEPYPAFPTNYRQEPFPSRVHFQSPSNRQLYLQSVPSVPSAPQNFLSEQGFGQGFRFGLSQPNFGLNQGFVSPQLGFESFPQINTQVRQPSNQIKFESFPKTMPGSPQAKPFANQAPKRPIQNQNPNVGHKFVDGYQLENASNPFAFPAANNKKKPQSLQKLKFEMYDKPKAPEAVPLNKPKTEREEVQLLYVPVESLNRGQFTYRNQQPFNTDPFAQTYQKPPAPQQTFASDFQRPVTKPLDNFNVGQEYFTAQNAFLGQDFTGRPLDQEPKFSTISSPFPVAAPTTPRPKKLKPHQPPLAVFFTQEGKKGDKIKVGDVLHTLKSAKTVAVLDTVSPSNAPKVFIGPSSLAPPDNYVKFELPYMSNLDSSDKKLKQLPFFVAPLSYNTPDGFAKIPFPSPHVGSVIVNAQTKDSSTQYLSTPTADVIPNSYTASSPSQEQTPAKPTFSYFSTAAPKTNAPPAPNDFKNSYYSIEPQSVSTLRPQEPEPNIVTAPPQQDFLNTNEKYKYEPVKNFNTKQTVTPDQRITYRPELVSPAQGRYESSTKEPVRGYNTQQRNSTPRTTTRLSTTKQATQSPSTYPSQLLETHNPYSINQAFHLSTPIDYQHYYDEYKEGYVTPGTNTPQPSQTPSPNSAKPEPVVTEKPKYQTSPNYLQNYSPEIHYESENNKYPTYNTDTNDYSTKPDVSSEVSNSEYSTSVETQPPVQYESPIPETARPLSDLEQYYQSTKAPSVYNQYVNNDENANIYREPIQETTTTTITTTTSTTTAAPITRRTPVRTRGRPNRYTTEKPESSETTKATVTATRRPLRERRPLPSRSKYEPNKITTERITRRPVTDSSEGTTKATSLRGRTRGRVQFKPSENEDGLSNKLKSSVKEADLAYQRDVLHQNYPVTIQERMSTVDIEAQTEPLPRISPSNNLESITDTYLDTEQAYSNEQAYSKQAEFANSRNPEYNTEASYVPRLPTTREEEYVYNSRGSAVSAQSNSYSEASKEESIEYTKPTEKTTEFVTEPSSPVTEEPIKYSIDNSYSIRTEEEIATTRPDLEITKIGSSAQTERETEESVPQTTPTYRVRVRPGVRQNSQVSTESTSTTARTTKIERRRPVQAVTYRPSYDRRRTTMRIEEIEADLKTKQVVARPEQDYRHPVYKPEPSTAPPATTPYTEPTKRGQFRRRRPSYTTTSTEATVNKKAVYDTKSRFKGRRPTTEKQEKPEVQTHAPSTSRTVPYSRYARPKLSERYNKKPVEVSEENEDQEPNYSITRPRFVSLEEQESDQWSADSFKPYNPNDIQEDRKVATTERRSDRIDELDIITARNDYEDILVSVTPASNRANKKVPDIPPTLEALVEQSKVASESSDSMSNFESMLEEVMKSLEEQDENEYTTNVMKHKGGEIGEIPPESIAPSDDNNTKTTTVAESDVTTAEPEIDDSTVAYEEDQERHARRRGFWKKVHVRPLTTESIEVAESQYYTNTVNHLGDSVKPAKKYDHKDKAKVTTYKPQYNFIKDIFDDEEKDDPTLEFGDIPKLTTTQPFEDTTTVQDVKPDEDVTEKSAGPGEIDMGTGSPDPTVVDMFYTPTSTEASSEVPVDRNDGMSLMDYLFGVSSPENESAAASENSESVVEDETEKVPEIETKTDTNKPKVFTTESTFIPDEITAVSNADETTEGSSTELGFNKNNNGTEASKTNKYHDTDNYDEENVSEVEKVETSSVSSFMDPSNVVSTSMSTEISHETEICFRGKCIKTRKDGL